MSIEVLIDAFRLPAQALVAHRIPKKMLVEQGAHTAAAKARQTNQRVAQNLQIQRLQGDLQAIAGQLQSPNS